MGQEWLILVCSFFYKNRIDNSKFKNKISKLQSKMQKLLNVKIDFSICSFLILHCHFDF